MEQFSLRIIQNDLQNSDTPDDEELDDFEIAKKLDSSFRRLIWSRDCSTLLKQCLTKKVFDVLKTRRTDLGATLYDVIQVKC